MLRAPAIWLGPKTEYHFVAKASDHSNTGVPEGESDAFLTSDSRNWRSISRSFENAAQALDGDISSYFEAKMQNGGMGAGEEGERDKGKGNG